MINPIKYPFTQQQLPTVELTKESSLYPLIQEIVLEIFSFLPFKELMNSSLVCKQWRVLIATESLWDQSEVLELAASRLGIDFFDRQEWKKHEDISIEDLPPKDIVKIVREALKFQELGCEPTIVAIPKGMNLGECLNSTIICASQLMAIAKHPQVLATHSGEILQECLESPDIENALQKSYPHMYWEMCGDNEVMAHLNQKIGDLKANWPVVQHSYRAVVAKKHPMVDLSRDQLEGPDNVPIKDQKDYISSKNCEISSMLETAVVFLSTTYRLPQKTGLAFDRWKNTFVYCSDMLYSITGQPSNAVLGRLRQNFLSIEPYNQSKFEEGPTIQVGMSKSFDKETSKTVSSQKRKISEISDESSV